MFGIFITFLGVGMVAIPTGIISAGFVDQYSTIKKKTEYGYESDMHFIKINIVEEDKWVGKQIAELQLPKGIIVAIIKRKEDLIIPRGDVVIEEDDTIVLGAYGNIKCEIEVLLKEVSGEEVEQEEFEDAFENLCETLWHQMSFYKASYLAMPYMLKFLEQKIIFLYNSVGSLRG